MKDKIESVRSEEIMIDDKDKKCAPTINFKDGSCIPLYLLVEMAKGYNKTFDDKIKLYDNVHTLNPKRYKRYLLKHFSYRLKDVCKNQRCWIKQKFINKLKPEYIEELRNFTHRPKGPQGKFTWLNTTNVEDVMKQYERKYKNFRFIGGVPIDFDELDKYRVKFDKKVPLNKAMSEDYIYSDIYKKQKKSKIGVIFNLDEHYKTGSHWVAGFADLKKGKVYYYDSYGIEPEERIAKFLRRLSRISKKITNKSDADIDARHNDVKNQKGGSECGVFSLSFILRMLKYDDFDKIRTSGITDSEVNKCRDVYFL